MFFELNFTGVFMRFFAFLLLFALAISTEKTAVTINGVDYSDSYFYSKYSLDEWSAADSTRKHDMLSDFIKRMTGTLAATELNLQNFPK
ncbi:MAG: hypothetical protein GXO91_09710, partial [FCB group bacterium]|nr:hypothetical protein [FCB group bacterium]